MTGATATRSDPAAAVAPPFIFAFTHIVQGMRSDCAFGHLLVEHCFEGPYEDGERELYARIEAAALERSPFCNGVVQLDIAVDPWPPEGGMKLTATGLAVMLEPW